MDQRQNLAGDGDLALLERVYRGESEAVDELLARHEGWLWSYVRRHMSAQIRVFETSGDVVQDVFRKLLEQGPRFMPRDDNEFRRLTGAIVLNRLRDRFRWAQHPGRVARDRPGVGDLGVSQIGPAANSSYQPSRVAQQKEQEAMTQLALELCDPEDADALRMRFWDEASFEQIGQHLGIQPDAARMRVNRAKLRLGGILRRLEEGKLESFLPDPDVPI